MDIQEFKRKKVQQSSESSSSEEDDAFVDDEPSQITRVTRKNANDNSWQTAGCVIVQVNLPVSNAAEVKTENSGSEIKSESGKSQNMSNVSKPSIYQQPLEPIQRKMKPQRYMLKPQIQYFYRQKALNDYKKKTKYQQKHDNTSQYENRSNRSNRYGYNHNKTTQRSQYLQSQYGQYNRQERQQIINKKQYGQNYTQSQQYYGSAHQSQRQQNHKRNYQQPQHYQDQSQYSEYETIYREQYKVKAEEKLSTTSSSDRKAQESQKKQQDLNFQKKKTDHADKISKKKQQQDELSMSFQALKNKEQEQQQIQRQERKKQQQRKMVQRIKKQQVKTEENKRKTEITNKKPQVEIKPAKSSQLKEKVEEKPLHHEKVEQKPAKLQQNKNISKNLSTQKAQLSQSNTSNQTSNNLNNAKQNITISKIHSQESKPPQNPKDESSLWQNSSQQDQQHQPKNSSRNHKSLNGSLQQECHQISLDFPLPPPMQLYDNPNSSMFQEDMELLQELNPTAIIKSKQSGKTDELNSDKSSIEGKYRTEKNEKKSIDSQQFDKAQLKTLEKIFGGIDEKKSMTSFIELRIKTANVAWYKIKSISSKIFDLEQVQLGNFKTNGIISVNQSQKIIPRDPLPFARSKIVEEKTQYKESKLILCSFLNPLHLLNSKQLEPALNAKIKSLKQSFSNVHELLSIEQITLRCGVCSQKKNFFCSGAPLVHGCDIKCANILKFQITDMYVV